MNEPRFMDVFHRMVERHQQLFRMPPAELSAAALQERFEGDGLDIAVDRVDGVVLIAQIDERRDLFTG